MTFGHPPDSVPSGLVRPFYGDVGDVPEGWAVCDGNNGTSDLRDKFIKSTTSATALPGSTGGQSSVTLSTGQMASHGHGGSSDSQGSHDHTFYTDDDGVRNRTNLTADETDPNNSGNQSVTTSYNGNHSHTMSVSNAGSDNSIDNRPSYTEMLFIMKL